MENERLTGLQSNRVSEAQTMRLEPSQSQVSFTNGYSESGILGRQGSADVGREEKDGQSAMTLEQDLMITKRTEAVQAVAGAHSDTCGSHAFESNVVYCPVDVLRNGSISELDVNLCHFSDSSGYSSERDSMPLFSVSETVLVPVTCSALGPDLKKSLSTTSSIQLSSAKTDDLKNSVCQAVVSICNKSGATTRATSAPVASSYSDVAACTMNVQVTRNNTDVVASATAASCQIDAVASDTSLSVASNHGDMVAGASSADVCQAERCVHENLPQMERRVCGESVEKRSSTNDEESVRVRLSLNSKQRYSDVPVHGLCVDILPGNLDLERHASLLLPREMESPKSLLVSEEKTKAQGILSDVQSVPVAAANSAANATVASSESAQERTVVEDPLLKKRYDRRSVTSISSDSRVEMRPDLPPISPGCIVMSQSTEKITGRNNARVQFFPSGGIVRSSRSQENYFDSGDITCVDIDLDDNIASSVDALHYDTSSMASLDSLVVPDWPIDGSESDLSLQADEQCFRSSDPDRASLPATLAQTETHSASVTSKTGLSENALQTKPAAFGQVLQPKAKQAVTSTSRLEDQRPTAGHGIALSINSQEVEAAFGPQNRCAADNVPLGIPSLSNDELKQSVAVPKNTTVAAAVQSLGGATHKDFSVDLASKTEVSASTPISTDGADYEDEDDVDAVRSDDLEFLLRDESIFRQPTKDVDRPSAARLAKRLFYLHGFKKSDVSRHLSKKNSFSQLVGEEYLKYFDFSGEALDGALRRFMKHMTIYGETQDRERLLAHFSCRYQQCNPDSFKSEDCCHTLACALLLLNQDLSGQNIGRKITLPEFISNLADMNDGEHFPKELLKSFYQSIKDQPLDFEVEESHDPGGGSLTGTTVMAQTAVPNQPRFVSYNPFYEIPDPSNAVEFKKGYVMRKCCLEPDGRKTPLGKRGWKMFCATLRDMVLHLHIDEHGFKRNQHYTSASNAIHIHHSLATKATDYQKKNHVFRLQTADMAQYLIQTSDSKECQEWIDAVNFVAASYSAPSPVSSITSQKRFQRPLLPSTYTRLNLKEQINHHEKMIAEFDRELLEHRKNPPEKGAKTRLIQDYCKKENYLKFELKRYKTYCRLLQYKVSTFPELEPSLAEIAIGEVDEPTLSNSPVESPFDSHGPTFFQSSLDSHNNASGSSGLHF